MATKLDPDWPHPGARWWKFDFHTHTPASRDTPWHSLTGSADELTPEQWLQHYMEAGIDCVAITDHNSGAWIDRLKAAYASMQQSDEQKFRKLYIFPGVEISVHGGFHLLVIFDPEATTRTVTDLLARVHYQGTDGDSDDVTQESAVDVLQAVVDAGGIPVPAHSDQAKGLLQVKPGTLECLLDANTVRQVMDFKEMLAVEWLDTNLEAPSCVQREVKRLAKVVGSDCHNFRGERVPGFRYTWVKMANPTLEGLRLALLDGNGSSIRRSDDPGHFDPLKKPTNFIAGIEVESARFMGNGACERLEFTPYYNALIGGRGTGKSTVVHAMRLAFRRTEELRRLDETTEPWRQFEGFSKSPKGREGGGALRDDTEIRIELMRDGVLHRLRWRRKDDGKDPVVMEQGDDGGWHESASQAVTNERFSIRLFSQGQIAAMAGESRQALLGVIDEAAGVGRLQRRFDDATRTYLSQQAKLRELRAKLERRPELKRQLADLDRTFKTLASSGYAEILQARQKMQRQDREMQKLLKQLKRISDQIESFAQDLLLDDWPENTFDSAQDQDLINWRSEADQAVSDAREGLIGTAHTLAGRVQSLRGDRRLVPWRQRVERAQTDHRALQDALEEQGVTDPMALGRLEQEHQRLEGELKQLDQLRQDSESLEADIQRQWAHVLDCRKAISREREGFLNKTLAANDFVRITVDGLGFESRNIERNLRDLLDVLDGRFESDILGFCDGIAKADDRYHAVEQAKDQMIGLSANLSGHFRNYLERRLSKPETADQIQCWFPDDDLHIEYSRSGDGRDWSNISQGSQGQRSAALLAFLLTFGDEPLILDQPEGDLDNHLIYELIVRQILSNKQRRQLIIVTHNPNIVVNGDAEMVHALDFRRGQCRVVEKGALQEKDLREQVCRIMEGGREAFSRRWERLGREV